MTRRVLPLLLATALIAAACSGSDDDSTADTTVDTESVDTEPVDTEPADTEPADTEPADTEPVDTESADTEPVDTEPADIESADGAAATVALSAPEHAPLTALVSAAADAAVQVEVTATSGDHVVEVPRTAAFAEVHDVPLVGMRPDRTYAVSVEMFDESGASVGVVDGNEFTTPPLPEWVVEHELTIDPERAAPGYTIIEVDTLQTPEGAPSSQYLLAYDNDGEIVWYYANTGAMGGVEQTVDGTFLMHYWPFGVREVDMLGNVLGNWRPQPAETEGDTVDDEALLENIDPEQLAFFTDPLRGNPGDAEPIPVRAPWIDLEGIHHENWPMPDGNILALATARHELTPEQRATFCPDDPTEFNVISDVVVEFTRAGEVLRTWDLWDVLDIDEFPGNTLCQDAGLFAESDLRDWTHANSVTYDPEREAILISVRHTNQIVALDYLEEEGPQSSLRWILGDGATMPYEGDRTYYQHAVEVLDDGAIISYDNGNFRPGTSPDDPENLPYSRAVIIDVDDSSPNPSDWTASQRWEFRLDDENGVPIYASFISDADVLSNGNVLITNGGIGSFPPDPEDPLHILITEVVPADGPSGGEIVWQFESGPGMHTAYRAERIESFYATDDWIPRT